MAIRLGMEIPALVDFPPETKKFVINAIKVVLKRFKNEGLMDAGIEYGRLLADPLLMHTFIECFIAKRGLAANIVIDKKGKPVEDNHTELVCGVSLAQVERLLVFTCAKRMFREGGWQDAQSTGALVPEELKRVLSFYWQLPLLSIYRDLMRADHFQVLGDAVLAVRDPDTLREIAGLSPTEIVKVKAVTGNRFNEMMQVAPHVLTRVAMLSPEKFHLFSEAAGTALWRFLESDEQTIRFLMGVVGERVEALGPVLADVSLMAARILTDLPSHILAPTVTAFVDTYGRDGVEILRDEAFVVTHVQSLVDTLRSMESGLGPKGITAAAAKCWQDLSGFVAMWQQDRDGEAGI